MVSYSVPINPNHIFVDTNVLIGAYSGMSKFSADAKSVHLLSSMVGKRVFVSSLSVAQLVSSFQKKKMNKQMVVGIVNRIRQKFEVVGFVESDIDNAMKDKGDDLEDNIQHVIARKMHCQVFVTNNRKDYRCYQDIFAVSPSEVQSLPR